MIGLLPKEYKDYGIQIIHDLSNFIKQRSISEDYFIDYLFNLDKPQPYEKSKYKLINRDIIRGVINKYDIQSIIFTQHSKDKEKPILYDSLLPIENNLLDDIVTTKRRTCFRISNRHFNLFF